MREFVKENHLNSNIKLKGFNSFLGVITYKDGSQVEYQDLTSVTKENNENEN